MFLSRVFPSSSGRPSSITIAKNCIEIVRIFHTTVVLKKIALYVSQQTLALWHKDKYQGALIIKYCLFINKIIYLQINKYAFQNYCQSLQ